MGLGGGFLATIYTKSDGKVESLTARETAPKAATTDMYANQTVTGALAIGKIDLTTTIIFLNYISPQQLSLAS